MYNRKLTHGPSALHRTGCFAAAGLASGELVWASDPGEERYYVQRSVVETWGPERRERFYRQAYQVERDVYFDCSDQQTESEGPTNSMNHCCDPNTWWDGDHRMVARRAIAAGEEVTYDYGTGHADPFYGFDCACRAPTCRGRVTGDDHLARDFQRRYEGHILAFMVTGAGAA